MTIVTAIEARRRQVDASAAAAGGGFVFEGAVDLDGSGEAITDVFFQGLKFRERPHPSFGGSLMDNETYDWGSLPTCNGFVLRWLFEVDRATTARVYTGAKVGWVVTGKATMKSRGHFSFAGRALVPDA